mmetsp:Transcript_1138/g.3359  ORF Transcript_1138/g.3359 Transcript_1138/m.3359 type:complete len:178 (+) Transcript_1138:181-714(+)
MTTSAILANFRETKGTIQTAQALACKQHPHKHLPQVLDSHWCRCRSFPASRAAEQLGIFPHGFRGLTSTSGQGPAAPPGRQIYGALGRCGGHGLGYHSSPLGGGAADGWPTNPLPAQTRGLRSTRPRAAAISKRTNGRKMDTTPMMARGSFITFPPCSASELQNSSGSSSRVMVLSF